ncbi:hypothetical protein C8R45DRAFT_1081692 [Mycena sanguinolenta]|nr:hypothetical protein C8R45DRAFT_1081692 [Mycena sanguinolenta]
MSLSSPCSQCGPFFSTVTDKSELSLNTDPRTLARFAQLAATNDPPHGTELSVLRPIVEKTGARLASLDAEILRLQSRLQELEEERVLLAKYNEQNTTIVSPVRRVPAEILGEIFSWTLPYFNDVLSPRQCPWILTHVCGSWRAVAISKPSLWSLINIDFTIEEHYPVEMVRTQMARARSLKVHFYGSEDLDSSAQISFFRFLAEECERWEELSLQLTSDLLPYVMGRSSGFTALRRAWVQWDTDESQAPHLESLDLFQMAIALVDISVHSEYRFIQTRLPMVHQLTRYDFDAPWQTHYELLKSLPNLQQACLSLFDEPEAWPDSTEPIDLPNLRQLHVTHPRSLDYLRAPNLEELGILVVTPPAPWTHVERLLLRSACASRRLRIKGSLPVQPTADFFQKFLCFTDVAITPLNAKDERLQREVLSAMNALFSVSPSTPPALVLPHITHIGFGSRNTDIIVCPLFLEILESRWKMPGRTLKAAELLFVNLSINPDSRSAARMKLLREAGLQLSLLAGQDARDRLDQWLHKAEWAY